MGDFAAFGPAVGAVEGVLEAVWRAVGGWAVVEGHDDVGTEEVLDAHGFFRREADDGSVDVAAESDAVGVTFGDDIFFGVVEIPQVGKGEDLESAGVGEHGAVPAGEFLEAAE